MSHLRFWLTAAGLWSICCLGGGFASVSIPMAQDILRNCPQMHPGVYTPTCIEGSSDPERCGKLEVEIIFVPQRFMGIDDPSEAMTLSGILSVQWYAACPGFNVSEEQWFTLFEGNAIWNPAFYHINSVNDYGMLFFTLRRLLRLTEKSRNNVLFRNQYMGVFESTCDHFYYAYFPFDSQSCDIKFYMPYKLAAVHLALHPAQENIFTEAMDLFMPPGKDWQFTNVSVSTYTQRGSYYAAYHFVYKRKPTYYVYSTLAPVLLLTFLQIAAFFISPEGNDRAMFSVTLLLALTFLNSQILNLVPVKPERILLMNYTDLSSLFSWCCTLYSITVSWLIHKTKHYNRQVVLCGRFKYSAVELLDLAVCCLAVVVFLAFNCYILIANI